MKWILYLFFICLSISSNAQNSQSLPVYQSNSKCHQACLCHTVPLYQKQTAKNILAQLCSVQGGLLHHVPDICFGRVMPYIAKTRDGNIHLDTSLYKLCQSLKKDSLETLSFVIAHEFSHLIQWQEGNAYLCHLFNTNVSPIDSFKIKEVDADIKGNLYARLAGYNPCEGVNTLFDSISYRIGKDLGDRKKIALSNCQKAEDLALMFDMANVWLIYKQYNQAEMIYKYLLKQFDSREIRYNLAIVRLQLLEREHPDLFKEMCLMPLPLSVHTRAYSIAPLEFRSGNNTSINQEVSQTYKNISIQLDSVLSIDSLFIAAQLVKIYIKVNQGKYEGKDSIYFDSCLKELSMIPDTHISLPLLNEYIAYLKAIILYYRNGEIPSSTKLNNWVKFFNEETNENDIEFWHQKLFYKHFPRKASIKLPEELKAYSNVVIFDKMAMTKHAIAEQINCYTTRNNGKYYIEWRERDIIKLQLIIGDLQKPPLKQYFAGGYKAFSENIKSPQNLDAQADKVLYLQPFTVSWYRNNANMLLFYMENDTQTIYKTLFISTIHL